MKTYIILKDKICNQLYENKIQYSILNVVTYMKTNTVQIYKIVVILGH